jgi:hypothetical protein
MSAPAATGRAPVAVAAGLLLAVLAGCGDERGALVTFTLSADEMTALRQQAGPGGQVRGEVFVARGAAGALRREPNLGDAGPTDSWTFDDDDLPGGFTVQVTDADSDLVTVALAVWAEPADVDDTWIPTSGAYFVARQVNPSGGLRAYAAPLALVPTGTQRRLDCPASIDPRSRRWHAVVGGSAQRPRGLHRLARRRRAGVDRQRPGRRSRLRRRPRGHGRRGVPAGRPASVLEQRAR